MAESAAKRKATARKAVTKKTQAATKARAKQAPRRKMSPSRTRTAMAAESGPLTLAQAKAIVRAQGEANTPKRALRRRSVPGAPGKFAVAAAAVESASPEKVAAERKRLALKRHRENQRRIREYAATLKILKRRGVKGLSPSTGKRRRRTGAGRAAPTTPLQILAEGDSWFDYPVPFFNGGIITRLERRVGVPILSLANAGDEVRFMLGVEERALLAQQLTQGCPAGGPWDVLLFSGGGNDVVDNPMVLWVKDFDAAIPPGNLLHQTRFDAVLALVRAGYEDLIAMRDALSPSTHLIFHAYDFAIPDGRGICRIGPWLKPALDARGFPTGDPPFQLVKAMLKQFAALLQSLTRSDVSFINAQGTLLPQSSSWHNELHPSKEGFGRFADIFHAHLKEKFPGRVL